MVVSIYIRVVLMVVSQESCSETFLKCYLLDLEMILQEEKMLDVTYDNSHNIRSFIEDCSPHSVRGEELSL